MIRGYAIGLGAGTQVLTHLPWFILIGTAEELSRAMLVGAGWVINVIVAEWIIRTARLRREQPVMRTDSTGRSRNLRRERQRAA